MNRKNKIMAAVTAALAAGAIGGGFAAANAAPMPASPAAVDIPEPGDSPDAPGAIDAPEPGDSVDVAGVVDRDNVQRGDQIGPEVPDTPATHGR